MENKSLIKICKILTDKKLMLSIAESCTGGLISSRFTDIAGASNFISQNFVTYSEYAKHQILGVSIDTIKKYNVVSEEVAREMACGLIKKHHADVAISTTGILGPSGFDENRPIGLCFIGFATKNRCVVHKFVSNKKTRIEIKKDIVRNVFELFLTFLTNEKIG